MLWRGVSNSVEKGYQMLCFFTLIYVPDGTCVKPTSRFAWVRMGAHGCARVSGADSDGLPGKDATANPDDASCHVLWCVAAKTGVSGISWLSESRER